MNHIRGQKSYSILSVFLFSIFFLTSCLQITFTEPQPAGKKNISKFPKHLTGSYLSLRDGSELVISESKITKLYEGTYRVHPNELDSTFIFEGDSILTPFSKQKYLVKQDRDSLLIFANGTQEMFTLNENSLLRKYKGYYFLNTMLAKDKWSVEQVELSGENLTISKVSPTEQKKPKSEEDSVDNTNLSLSRKEFKKFVRSNGFDSDEVFVRKNNFNNP